MTMSSSRMMTWATSAIRATAVLTRSVTEKRSVQRPDTSALLAEVSVHLVVFFVVVIVRSEFIHSANAQPLGSGRNPQVAIIV